MSNERNPYDLSANQDLRLRHRASSTSGIADRTRMVFNALNSKSDKQQVEIKQLKDEIQDMRGLMTDAVRICNERFAELKILSAELEDIAHHLGWRWAIGEDKMTSIISFLQEYRRQHKE